MNNLIKVNTKLMLKRKDIKICAVVAVILAILEVVISKHNENLDWYSMFEMPFVFIMILTAIGGLFISRDYSQNTIRNKITVGQKRAYIYMANQITTAAFFCISIIIIFITSFILNFILIGAKDADFSKIFTNIAVCMIATISLSALTTFISMTIKSASGGVLPIILMEPLMMLSAFESELPDVKWLQIVCDIIPLCQLASLMMPDEQAGIHIMYSILCTAFFVLVGVTDFRKSDLK